GRRWPRGAFSPPPGGPQPRGPADPLRPLLRGRSPRRAAALRLADALDAESTRLAPRAIRAERNGTRHRARLPFRTEVARARRSREREARGLEPRRTKCMGVLCARVRHRVRVP